MKPSFRTYIILAILTLCTAMIGLIFTLKTIPVNDKIQRLMIQNSRLEEENKRLTITLSALEHPQTIEEHAKKLGMIIPSINYIVITPSYH